MRRWAPIASVNGTTTSYYHEDALGSVGLVSSSTDTTIFTSNYKAYGPNYGKSGSSTVQYTGKPVDTATGLYYSDARWYDPATGRYTTENAYMGSLGLPLSLDRYAYALDNPMSESNGTMAEMGLSTEKNTGRVINTQVGACGCASAKRSGQVVQSEQTSPDLMPATPTASPASSTTASSQSASGGMVLRLGPPPPCANNPTLCGTANPVQEANVVMINAWALAAAFDTAAGLIAAGAVGSGGIVVTVAGLSFSIQAALIFTGAVWSTSAAIAVTWYVATAGGSAIPQGALDAWLEDIPNSVVQSIGEQALNPNGMYSS